MKRLPLDALDQSGATDGQIPVWNASESQWRAGSPGGGGGTSVLAKSFRDTIASDFTTTSVGTYVTVTALTLSVTPTVNSVLMFNSRIGMFSTAANGVDLNAKAIISPAPVAGVAQIRARNDNGLANVGESYCIVGTWDLAAGTAYTITAQVYQSSSGTLTVYAASDLTELCGVLLPI